MRRKQQVYQLAVAALLAASSLLAQGGRPAASYKDLKYPPLNKVRVPETTQFQMSNGIKVFLVEDHELPTVGVAAMVRAGSRWEPAGKLGLASITGSVMRTGGSVSRNGDALDQELDRMGASVETGIGRDQGMASVSVLKGDIDKGLTILSDILQHPAFPQDKIDLAKISERDQISRRNDEAMRIANREFARAIFGKDSPYARQPEYDTIASITRDDLVAFHKQFYQPESVILGAWGDFSSAEMRGRIEKAFGGWERGGHAKPEAPAVETAARNRRGIYFVNKDDVNQSNVYMGCVSGRRDDPDYFALTVMNNVLGGGFASRLFSQVRSEQGLAYSVGSGWGAEWDHAGLFTASGGTKSGTTVKIVQAIRREIDRLAQGPVLEDEIARAKDGILKGGAFDYDSTGKIVNRLMLYAYFGYPQDYLQKYEAGIRAVTKADVERVAKQYLKSDQFTLLVLGKEKDFDQPLSTLGAVTTVDITIPKPRTQETGVATPESLAKGKSLLAAALKATGASVVKNLKDISLANDLTVTTPQGEMNLKVDATMNFSGKLIQKMATPMGEITQGYDGSRGWVRSPQGTQDAPASARAQFESGIFGNILSVLQRMEGPGITAKALEPSAGLDGAAVSDPAHNLEVKFYFDPKTGLPAKRIATGAPLGGPPGEIEDIFDDYRETDGLKMPFHSVTMQNGKKVAEMRVTSIKVNPGLDESAYRKP